MAITYTYTVENELLKVTTQGKDESFQDAVNYARGILVDSIQNECSMILCDERNLEYNLSVVDMFKLAEGASKEAKNLKKIAIVCKEEYLEEGKFYENVSSNRGLTVLVTSDMHHAKKWLESKL
jgi:hypothetical protein